MKTIYDFVSKSEKVVKWLQSLLRFNLCLNFKWSENLEMQITVLPLGNFAEVDDSVCSWYLSDVVSLIDLGTKACPIQFYDEILDCRHLFVNISIISFNALLHFQEVWYFI